MNKEIKKFGLRSFFLVTIILVLINVSNFLYDSKIGENKEIFRQEKLWQEYKNTIENNTLEYGIFGDSHALNSLNPLYINNSYNFATNGEGYIETYYKIKKITEKDNIKIKNFVLQIDTQTFSSRLRKKDILFNEISYYDKFVPLKTISELKEEKQISLFLESNIRTLGKGTEIVKYTISPPTLTQLNLGWSNNTKNKSTEEIIKELPDAYNTHYSQELNLLDEKSIEYLIKVLEYAKENNIGIIFVKYPVSKNYADYIQERNIPRDRYYEELFSIINSVMNDYKVLDYYTLLFYDNGLFADSNHVNWAGSEIVSKKFSKDVEKETLFSFEVKIN